MESGAVSFVSAWHKNPHHVCSTYASELWSRIQVVKPNAKLYTRQYSSFSQTLQFSLLPRLANSAQLWCLQINFIYLKIKKIMAFVLYFKRKTETMETVRKKKTKQIILSLNSEHTDPLENQPKSSVENKISTKNRVHAYIQHFVWESLITVPSAQKPYLRYLFQICPGFI